MYSYPQLRVFARNIHRHLIQGDYDKLTWLLDELHLSLVANPDGTLELQELTTSIIGHRYTLYSPDQLVFLNLVLGDYVSLAS